MISRCRRGCTVERSVPPFFLLIGLPRRVFFRLQYRVIVFRWTSPPSPDRGTGPVLLLSLYFGLQKSRIPLKADQSSPPFPLPPSHRYDRRCPAFFRLGRSAGKSEDPPRSETGSFFFLWRNATSPRPLPPFSRFPLKDGGPDFFQEGVPELPLFPVLSSHEERSIFLARGPKRPLFFLFLSPLRFSTL